jgi:hypothetical protein
MPTSTPTRLAVLRVLSRVTLEDRGFGTPCWIWTGATNGKKKGYGKISTYVEGRSFLELAHRVIYAAWYGEIADGLEVDHLCFQRRCCSPQHLEAVQPIINLQRQAAHRREIRRTRELAMSSAA